MGRACYHPRPTGARRRTSLLERAHKFLCTRDRAAFEAAADRFFAALGYRRRADRSDGGLVFERGEGVASIFSASMRRYPTRLEVSVDGRPAPNDPAVAHVRHHVDAFAAFILERDRRYLDVEARAFERFLERGDLDVDEIVAAAQARSARPAWLLLGGFFALVAVALGIVGWALAALVRDTVAN